MIIDLVFEFIAEKLLFIFISFLLYIIWRVFKLKKIKMMYVIKPLREIVLAVFFLYIIVLTSITVVPDYEITSTGIHFIGLQIIWNTSYFSQHTNLIPFSVIYKMFVRASFPVFALNILGNISVFIPLGFVTSLLWKIKAKRVVLLGVFSSCLIEVLQLPQTRTSDIDDIILNTFGCLIGCLLYVMVEKISPKFCVKFKLIKRAK